MRTNKNTLLLLLAMTASLGVKADGISVNRIENPYVQPLEHEIAYQLLDLNYDNNRVGSQIHQFEYGHALNDRWLLEFEVLGQDQQGQQNQGIRVQAYEVAAKYQLTEQGEFSSDWGLQFEVEKLHDKDSWGVGVTLIGLREFGRFVATVNLGVEAEFGRDIEDEIESSLGAQLKYRVSPKFEPAVEIFRNQAGTFIGPSALGQVRFSGNRKLFWDLGWLFGINNESSEDGFAGPIIDSVPERVVKLSLEYEFY